MSKEKPTYQALENQIIELKKSQIDTTINNDNQYKLLFDSMTELVQTIELIYNAQGRPIDWYIRDINLSFAKFLGKTKDQLVGQKVSSIIDVVEDYWFTSFASVDQTGTKINFEHYGVEFDKYYHVTAWKVSKNRVGVSYTDITDKKRSERDKLALEKTKNELAEAHNLAKIGSWLFNPVTLKPEWSDEMFRIWDFDSSNGTPKYDVVVKRIHPDDLDFFNYSVGKASASGVPYNIEFRIYTATGKQKTIKAICQPILGVTGEVSSLKGINQDISSQKLFEEDLIKHQRLIAVGEMSSSIAHDFNNSLQAIMGNLEVVILKNNFPESTSKYLNNIELIISDISDRVAALQRFGDTDHENVEYENINFNTMISESLTQARPLWKDNLEKEGFNITVTTDFKDIPNINCNRGELKSAFYNLIKNSIEAMPEGGDLRIVTGVKYTGVFAIFIDTGTGMDIETKLKLFQPFYTNKGLNLGRGLGMSGVYTTVKKHKGEISIKSSELGVGTTIELYFPIGQQNNIEKIIVENPKERKSLAILWVDDDALIRETSSDFLELMGHKCETATCGKHALQHLSENTFDVVFTDIGMPEMNGWELADSIRNKWGNKIKIVVVSGWDVEAKVKNNHNINAALQKPFKMKQLKEILMTV